MSEVHRRHTALAELSPNPVALDKGSGELAQHLETTSPSGRDDMVALPAQQAFTARA